eukprot:138702_1
MSTIKQIDVALAAHYNNLNRDDYYDDNGRGKFIVFVEENKIDHTQIASQLSDNVNPNDCKLLSMDSNFPLNKKYYDNDERNAEIFRIFKRCYQHGKYVKSPPKPPPMRSIYTASQPNICCICNKQTSNKCGGCKYAYYCSANCQKKGWKKHKNQCKELKKMNKIGIDPFLFTDMSIDCKSIQDGCKCTMRIIAALKYYSKLNVMNNKTDKNKFVGFCHVMHKSLLDDFIHILEKHNNENDLEDIFSILCNQHAMNCNISNCKLSLRHFRNRNNDEHYNDKDDEFVFYRDIFDGIHFFLFHLYDTGMRVKMSHKTGVINDSKDDEQQDEQKYIDYAFLKICQIIKEKKKKLAKIKGLNLDRFYNSNKYTLGDNNKDQDTFMDGLIRYLADDTHISADQVQIFNDMLVNEEYDTDAVEFEADVNYKQLYDYDTDSNIALLGKLQHSITKKYVYYMKLYEHTFNVGYRFYYWESYKNKTVIGDVSIFMRGTGDQSGHLQAELYIEKKYNTLKEELLNNTVYTAFTVYKLNISMTKMNKYINTHKIKNMQISTPDSSLMFLDDDYGCDTHITADQLLAVILYCDETELQNEFSKTFRKQNSYDSMPSVKRRNREFANWSRILYETINVFGNCGYSPQIYDTATEEEKTNMDFEVGPYYCGLSPMMIITEFNMRLNSPTSTTKQIEVAQTFTDDKGIILQMNNNGHAQGYALKSWNCSWLSKYVGEAQLLWMGGEYTIKVEGIRIVSTAVNYQKYFSLMYYMDAMITGMNMRNVKCRPSNKDYEILSNLIKHKMKMNKFENKYPSYINHTFYLFINNKKHIVINIDYINIYFSKLKDLMMYKIKGSINNKQFEMTGNNETNLFKSILFDLFHNIKSIHIITTAFVGRGTYEYIIDILGLLSILNKSNLSNNIKITIRAQHKYIAQADKHNVIKNLSHIGVSWLGLLWNKYSQSIISKCKQNNWNVVFKNNIKV